MDVQTWHDISRTVEGRGEVTVSEIVNYLGHVRKEVKRDKQIVTC